MSYTLALKTIRHDQMRTLRNDSCSPTKKVSERNGDLPSYLGEIIQTNVF